MAQGSGDGRGSWQDAGGLTGLCRAVLRAAARVVPAGRRGSWLAERDGELWALWNRGRGGWALVRFAADGLADACRERARDGWVPGGVWEDVRHAARALRRSPGFAAVTVLVLAVGVGANTAIFSVLHAALLRPVPFPEPERLVALDLTVRSPESGEERALPFSWPAYRALEEAVSGGLQMAGFTSRDMTLLGAGDPARIRVEIVTPSYFGVVGRHAELGRVFAAFEAPPADAPVVVLSDGLWRRRFGRDPDVLGRSVRLNEAEVTVVGVMPAGFGGLTGAADAWVSMALAPVVFDPARLERPRSYWMFAVGRLRPDVSTDAATSMVRAAGPAVAAGAPDEGVELGARVVPFLEARVNTTSRLSILVVGGAAALLLIIACANVAGLLVARGAARRSELAVRVALGAGRARLLRGQLMESLALAVLGGLMGVGGAFLGVPLLAAALPRAVGTVGSNRLQFLDPATIGVDGPVLLFAVALTTLTGLLAGAWPAARAAGRASAPGLRASRTGHRAGTGGTRGRSLLVASQVALAAVLLAGTGLMLGSFARLQSVDAGVGNPGLVLASYELPRGTDGEEAAAFHRSLEEGLRGISGVRSASLAQCTPLSGRCDVTLAAAVEEGGAVPEDRIPAAVVFVGDDYFDVVGVPLLRGRSFGAGDEPTSTLAVVLSQEAVRRLLPSGDPLGRRIVASLGLLADPPGGRVVGVAGEVRYDDTLAGEDLAVMYVSYRQMPVDYMTVLVESEAPTRDVVAGVRSVVAALRPDVPLSGVTTLEEQMKAATARTRVVLTLLVLFAGTAVLLSALGVYGLTSFVVARRTREIGVRMIMGATAARVLGRVVGGAAGPAVAGLLVGLLAAAWLTRLMEALLFQVRPNDPGVLAGVAAVLLAAVLTAALVPGLRAVRVDPGTALRSD